jgi:D-alanyl-D-alanine carboxypeptidase/D-alanyl-D-alanine-endopeptidase (penicillin-binding protein 4)
MPPERRLACAALAIVAAISLAAHAALPRPLARAFAAAGVPTGAVAVVVQEVGAPRPLVAHNGNRPMNPASVMKLVTTFAALELLGPDYRWTTEAYLDGPLDGGVLHGNLVLKGSGDPKITVEQWQAFMWGLRAAGLAAIDGDLVLDRSRFAPLAHDPAAFDGEPLKPYNVGPDALLVNFKSVKFSFAPTASGESTALSVEPMLPNLLVGPPPRLAGGECNDWQGLLGATFVDLGASAEARFDGRYPVACGEREWWVALLDHPHYVHAMFTQYFRDAGGRFDGNVRGGLAPKDVAPFATLESPPLYEIIRDVNKRSNNVMARQIFLTLATTQGPKPATTARAIEAVQRWLAAQKLRMPELVLDNGSGLSRIGRVSAGSLVRLLLAADASSVREDFEGSLAIAAMDGTVERRFQNGGVAGQAQLKTGTLDNARAIAGYVLDADGRRFALAAIVNGPPAEQARAPLDFLVQWVYREATATKHPSHH